MEDGNPPEVRIVGAGLAKKESRFDPVDVVERDASNRSPTTGCKAQLCGRL